MKNELTKNAVMQTDQSEVIRRVMKEELKEFFGDQKSVNIENELITKKDIARLFRVSVVSVNVWEKKGLLPRRIVMGRRVFYYKNEVYQKIQSNH